MSIFQKTEIGSFPMDWKVLPLPQVSWFQEGPGLRQWQFTNIGMKVINVTNLSNGVLNLELTDRHISLKEFEHMYQHFSVDANDIVMASSGNSYGKTAKVRYQDLPLMMNTSVIRFKPLSETDYGFLWAFLNSEIFKNQIDLMITGGAQPNFGPFHLQRVLIPIPPLPEQEAIAEALADVDALLVALDKLIAKKRAIKQAAMQQLLTGKTRLPGFTGEWSEKPLGEFAAIRNQKVYPANVEPDTLCVELEHIGQGNGQLMERSAARNSTSSKYRFYCGDVLFGRLRPYLRKYWHAEDDGICTTEIWPLIVDPAQACSGFLFALVQADRFIETASISYGTHMPRADWNVVKNYEVSLPPVNEQVAIATVLSDMDSEITALEKRRDKTQQIKQGMMQQLLTGRIRLVNPSTAEATA